VTIKGLARSPRAAAVVIDLLIVAAAAATAWVWLVGPLVFEPALRPIHWRHPSRPLGITAALVLARLLLPLAAAAWRRVSRPVVAVIRSPWVWVPLLVLAIAAWPWWRHREFQRLVRETRAARAQGCYQIGLQTRPVVDDLEMLEGLPIDPAMAGGRMEIACGLPSGAVRWLDDTTRASVAFEVRGADGGHAEPLPGSCELVAGRWKVVSVDLPGVLKTGSHLGLRVHATDASAAPGGPDDRAARVAATLAFVSRPGFRARAAAPRPNLLLISLDTLRADHLGAYGYSRPVSPNIDRLAANGGVLFERAVSQAPWTTPSHMSLFTSLFPSVHAVDSPTSIHQRMLGEDRRTLAELLHGAGYATGAFTGSGSISALYGFWRGFEVYDETDKDDPERRGEDISGVFDKASSWLVAHRAEPFFLFFHSYEAHAPFVHETFLSEVPPDAGAEDPRRLEALYDGDILYADGFVGQLLALLEGLGLDDKTIVVLLSDHGEEFVPRYPGKRFGHGHTLYDDLLHVPLIVRTPGSARGLRVKAQVQIIDVMPTVLELLGVVPPEGLQGVSFAPALRGEAIAARRAFAEAINYGPERKTLFDGGLKYIKVFPRADKPAREISAPVPDEELFDLTSDPGERRSILAGGGARLDQLRKDLQALVALNTARRGAAREQQLDEETIRRLKALGYIQ